MRTFKVCGFDVCGWKLVVGGFEACGLRFALFAFVTGRVELYLRGGNTDDERLNGHAWGVLWFGVWGLVFGVFEPVCRLR